MTDPAFKLGDRVKPALHGVALDPRHPSAWKCWGVVRGIVDGHLVVRRWVKRRREHFYTLFDPGQIEMGMVVRKEST